MLPSDLISRRCRTSTRQMFPGSQIKVRRSMARSRLTGRVPNLQTADQVRRWRRVWKVQNFIEVSGGQQVQLQVKFAEVSRTATSQLGVNFGVTDGRTSLGITPAR